MASWRWRWRQRAAACVPVRASWSSEGKKLLAERNVPDAIVSFRRAIAASPLDEEAHYQLAVANLAIGNSRVGGEALLRAVQLKADDWRAVAKLGELMATSGDEKVLTGAREKLSQAVAHLPGDVAALTALAIVDWKLGAREAAEGRLEQALPSHPERLYSAITLAQMKMASGNAEGAEALLRAAAVGGEPASIIALAEFHMVAGRLEEAAGELRGALQREPRNAEARLDLAAIEASRNHMAAAAEAYRALADLPDRRYRPLYGVFLLQTGKAEQAVAEFERLLKLDPADEALRTNLLGAYLAAGREADAERMLRAAVEKRNPGFDALLQKALFDLGKDRTGEAQVSVLTALRLRPEAAEAHYLHAAVLLRRGEVRSAVEELSEAVRRNPAFLPARLELARFRIAARAPDAALEMLEGAPAEQRAAPAMLAGRAWVFLAMGNRERFGAELKAAEPRVASAMRIPEAVWRLEQSDPQGAQRIAEEALAAHPPDSRPCCWWRAAAGSKAERTAAIRNVRRYAENGPFLAELLLAAGRAPAALRRSRPPRPPASGSPSSRSPWLGRSCATGSPRGRKNAWRCWRPNPTKGRALPAWRRAADAGKVWTGGGRLPQGPGRRPGIRAGAPQPGLPASRTSGHAGRGLEPGAEGAGTGAGERVRRRRAGVGAVPARPRFPGRDPPEGSGRRGFARASAHLARMRARPDDPEGAPEACPIRWRWDGWIWRGRQHRGAPGDVSKDARLSTGRGGARRGAAGRNPRRFTERIVPPLMFCEPQPAFNPASMPSPQAVTLESVRALWTSPDLMLQRLFGLSGVNAVEAAGWDNTFISWDETRSPLRRSNCRPSPRPIRLSGLRIRRGMPTDGMSTIRCGPAPFIKASE